MEKIGEDIINIIEGKKSIYILMEICQDDYVGNNNKHEIISCLLQMGKKREDEIIKQEERSLFLCELDDSDIENAIGDVGYGYKKVEVIVKKSYKLYKVGKEERGLNDVSNPIMINIFKYMGKYSVRKVTIIDEILRVEMIYYGFSLKRAKEIYDIWVSRYNDIRKKEDFISDIFINLILENEKGNILYKKCNYY